MVHKVLEPLAPDLALSDVLVAIEMFPCFALAVVEVHHGQIFQSDGVVEAL